MTTREPQVIVRDRNGTAVLELHGDLDRFAEASMDRAYATVAADAQAIVLNFRHVEYINSTGIALIVGLLAQARAAAIPVSACGLSDHYREIFEITRLADFMTITDSEDGAVNRTVETHRD